MQQKLLIPVINAKGVEAHPYAPLKVGMLVYQASRHDTIQPEHVRKAAHVFDWERSFFFIQLEDDMIDWVTSSPWLSKPIFMFQMGGLVSPYPFDEHCKGVPLQHSLRRCMGYEGMVFALFDHGDIYEVGNAIPKSRAAFMRRVKENIPDMQIPSENYITPDHWSETSILRPNEHIGWENIIHRSAGKPNESA